MYHDTVVVLDAQNGLITARIKVGHRPYRIVVHPDGKALFVSSWSDGRVTLYDAKTGGESGSVRLVAHTTDMVLTSVKAEGADKDEMYRLFVAAANTNSVFVVSIDDTKQMKLAESINVAMTARHPLGMTPTAVSLSPDSKTLFVACSDANALAVVDVSETRSRVTGFIPTGWYPTASRMLAGGRIFVLNGRGLQSYPNP